MGRPRTTEPRKVQLNLCLTENELASIVRRAAAVGLRVSHYARTVLLDVRPEALAKTATDNAQRQIQAQLIRLGNNLNQLVRHLNATGDPVPSDLKPLLADIRQMITRIPR